MLTDFVDLSKKQKPSLAVETCNDIKRASGMIPTLVVFAALLRMPLRPHKLLSKALRMEMMLNDPKGDYKLITRNRINAAQKMVVATLAHSERKLGDKLLMLGEKPIGKWLVLM